MVAMLPDDADKAMTAVDRRTNMMREFNA